jgi:hypothetical protein
MGSGLAHLVFNFSMAILGIEARDKSEEYGPRLVGGEEGDTMGELFRRVVLVGATLALVALAMPMSGQSLHVSRASQATTTLAVDADPVGNSAASLAGIDPCVSIGSGETFDVDVVVTDVSDLSGWEAAFVYDGSVVTVVAVDTDLLLASGPGSQLVDLSPDPLPDTDGAYRMVVADISQTVGEDGSGLLARLTLQAVGQGASDLGLSEIILGDSAAKAIGDIDGDSFFDGPVSRGRVYVGEACPSGALPTLTPAPSPALSAEATPAGPAATGEPVGTAAPAAEEEDGFPWAIVAGASAGAVVAALALALVVGRLLRRG